MSLGYTTSDLDGGNDGASDNGYLKGNRFTMGSTAATVNYLNVYVAGPEIDAYPNNKYQLAIYANSGGNPGAKIVDSAVGFLKANSWNSLPISPTTLSASTTYWLAYETLGSNTAVATATPAAASTAYMSNTFGSMPGTFTTAGTDQTMAISASVGPASGDNSIFSVQNASGVGLANADVQLNTFGMGGLSSPPDSIQAYRSPNTPTFTYTGSGSGATYTYAAASVDSNGVEGNTSPTATTATFATTLNGTNYVKVNVNNTGATCYNVYRTATSGASGNGATTGLIASCVGSGNYSDKALTAALSPTIPSATNSLTASTSYSYTVTAVDGVGGESSVDGYNNEQGITTGATGRAVTLSWDKIAGARGYNVYRTAGSSGTETFLGRTTSTNYTDDGSISTVDGSTPPTLGTAFASQLGSGNATLTVGSAGQAVGQLYVSGSIGGQALSSTTVNASNGANRVKVVGRYAYVTRDSGHLQIYDVTKPEKPVLLSSLSGLGYSTQALEIVGKYAYVMSQSSGELFVVDISNPSSPSIVTTVSSAFTSSGNTAIQVQGRYLYLCDGTNLKAYDIANATNPVLAGTVALPDSNGRDMYVKGNYAYMADYGTLRIYSIANPASMSQVGSLGISSGVQNIKVQGAYVYIVDNFNSKIAIVNVTNPALPYQTATMGAGSNVDDVVIAGRMAYSLANSGIDNLRAYDISDPLHPVAQYPTVTTSSSPYSFDVQGRYAYVVSNTTPSKFEIYDLGGTYTQALEAGSAEISSVNVGQNLTVNQSAKVLGGLTVGQGAQIQGGLGVSGNLAIGSRTDSGGTTSDWAKVSNATAGTVCTQTAVDTIKSSVVYNGSLYIGTSEADKAEVCRYDGGTTWTRINSAAGTIGAATNTDTVGAMTVFNGYMYIGTTGGGTAGADTNKASVYRWDGGTTFTLVNTTQGTLITTANVDAVTAMGVYQGALYVGTTETNASQVVRYIGGTGAAVFTGINTTAGTFNTQASVDGVTAMSVYNGKLYIGTNEANAAQVLSYDGSTGAAVFTRINTTAGTFNTTASIDQVTVMTVYNGALYIGTNESAKAEVYRYDGTVGSAAPMTVLNATAGTFVTAASDQVSAMTVYNGELFIGTTKSNSAEVDLYTPNTNAWSKVSQAAGTIKSSGTASIDGVTMMIGYGDLMYVGTNEPNKAEVYTFSQIEGQSYALNFMASSDNAGSTEVPTNGANTGSIYFKAEQNSFNSVQGAGTGSFIFSSGISTSSGAYDLAEDYPTRDDALAAGDLVSIDPNETGFVRQSSGAGDSGLIGVYSEKPALRLSQQDSTINGGRAVPVALAGRVPVKVSTEHGVIMPGDPLTASSTPGVAMKANGSGRIVGMAMEAYSGDGVGKVMAFVNPNFYTGGEALQSSTAASSLVVNGALSAKDLTVNGTATVGDLVALHSVTAGNLQVTGITTVVDIMVSGHIITGGNAPAASILAAAGSNATVTIDGNDTSGTITIVTGDAAHGAAPGPSAGELAKAVYSQAFGKVPHIILTPGDSATAGLSVYPGPRAADYFTVGVTGTPEPNTTYTFEYLTVQ